MLKWLAIINIPRLNDMVRTPSSPLTDHIEWWSSNDQYKYWALINYRADGTATIKSHSGRFEEECHGATYTAAAVARFRQRLLDAGYVVSDTPGDMSNVF